MTYLLDTCALLDQRNRYYAPDRFPSFWRDLEELIDSGRLRSVDEVREELDKQDDEVAEWARARSGFFLPLDEASQGKAIEVLTEFPNLIRANAPGTQADPFIIGCAWAHSHTIITSERGVMGARKRVKIPDVCRHFGIGCLSIVEFLRREKLSY